MAKINLLKLNEENEILKAVKLNSNKKNLHVV